MAPSSSSVIPGTVRERYELGEATITVALDAGPRVVGYELAGHRNLFADLPDAVIDHPAAGRFWFIGGHRLWRAPEEPPVTYQSDHHAVEVVKEGGSLTVSGPPDSDGIVKVLTLTQHGPLTVVDHMLENVGTRSIDAAPWALTQLVPGGRAILPNSVDNVDADGLLPNRTVVLWPYSDVAASGVSISRSEIRIETSENSTKFKIGQPNRRGWVAYGMGDELFVKWAPLHDDLSSYVDLGSSIQCYVDSRFVELESLGPLTSLEPGDHCHHREVWTMLRGNGDNSDSLASLPPDPGGMQAN